MDDCDLAKTASEADEESRPEEKPLMGGLMSDSVSAIPTVPQLLSSVLRQFSLNFLLNDVSGSQSLSRLTNNSGPVRWNVPGREPQRRSSESAQVHQSRVSVRRLRSTLRTFTGVLDPSWTGGLLPQLSWYADVLGEVRDLDVKRAWLGRSIWLVDDERIQAMIMGHLGRQIEGARELFVEARATETYVTMIDEIILLDASIRFTPDALGPARQVLSTSMNATWRDVQKARRRAQKHPTNETLHRLRIGLKRLQCACEVTGVIEGRPITRVALAAESAQQKLGVVHDEAVAASWLRGLVAAEPRLKRPFRELLEFHDGARREAQRGWKDELRHVDRSWIRWREESS